MVEATATGKVRSEGGRGGRVGGREGGKEGMRMSRSAFLHSLSFPYLPIFFLSSPPSLCPPLPPSLPPSLPLCVSALQIPTDEKAKTVEEGKQSVNEILNAGGGARWHGGWNGWGFGGKGISIYLVNKNKIIYSYKTIYHVI